MTPVHTQRIRSHDSARISVLLALCATILSIYSVWKRPSQTGSTPLGTEIRNESDQGSIERELASLKDMVNHLTKAQLELREMLEENGRYIGASESDTANGSRETEEHMPPGSVLAPYLTRFNSANPFAELTGQIKEKILKNLENRDDSAPSLDELDCRGQVCSVKISYNGTEHTQTFLKLLSQLTPDSAGSYEFRSDSGGRMSIVGYWEMENVSAL